MSVLDEARDVERNPLMIYDGPTFRRIVKGLVTLIDTEREQHRQELRRAAWPPPGVVDAYNSGNGTYRP